jgi:LmbE family N-acetylglucosaminyl deacetylase
MKVNERGPAMKPQNDKTSTLARALTGGLSDTQKGRLLLRRAVLLAARATLRLRGRPLLGEPIKSALVIAPHPDDETFGCGGTVALLSQRHAVLDLVLVTDGCASHPNHPSISPADIASRRRNEVHAATSILGIQWERVMFLDIRDGTVSRLEDHKILSLETKLAAVLERLAPDAILLPCRNDGSSEHDATFVRVAHALGKIDRKIRIFEFPVWSWWNPLLMRTSIFSCPKIWRVDCRSVQDLKARAIAAYSSQTQAIPPETDPALPRGFSSTFLGGAEYFFEW